MKLHNLKWEEDEKQCERGTKRQWVLMLRRGLWRFFSNIQGCCSWHAPRGSECSDKNDSHSYHIESVASLVTLLGSLPADSRPDWRYSRYVRAERSCAWQAECYWVVSEGLINLPARGRGLGSACFTVKRYMYLSQARMLLTEVKPSGVENLREGRWIFWCL